MRKISTFCNFFSYITTGILFICAINFFLFNDGDIPRNTLWQILISSFITTTMSMFLSPWSSEKTRELILKTLLHYFCLCVIMIVCGIWFGWITLGFGGAMKMIISVAGVYVITFFLNYIKGKKQTEEINRALNKKRTKNNSDWG